MTNRPLLLVEDDLDDHEMMMCVFSEIGLSNPVKHFKDAESALGYLRAREEHPFLIVSDVNMPKMSGLIFKEQIESCSRLKGLSIPFVFLSTTASETNVREAFSINAQGFFVKGATYIDLKSTLATILGYWTTTRHPN